MRSKRSTVRESAFQFDPTVSKREPKDDVGLLVSRNLVELKARMNADEKGGENEHKSKGNKVECSKDDSIEILMSNAKAQLDKHSREGGLLEADKVDGSAALKNQNKSQISMKELIRNKLLAKKKAIEDKKEAESLRVQVGRVDKGGLLDKQTDKQKVRTKEETQDSRKLLKEFERIDGTPVNSASVRNHSKGNANPERIDAEEVKKSEGVVENKKLMKFLNNLKSKNTDKNDQGYDLRDEGGANDRVRVVGNYLQDTKKALKSYVAESDSQNANRQPKQNGSDPQMNQNKSANQSSSISSGEKDNQQGNMQNDAKEKPNQTQKAETKQTTERSQIGNKKGELGQGVHDGSSPEAGSKTRQSLKQSASCEIRETKPDVSGMIQIQMEADQLQREVIRVMTSANMAGKSPHSHNSLSNKRTKPHRLTTEEYESMVAKLSSLNLVDLPQFVTKPSQRHQLIQCTLVRDRSGLINKFYPVFHMFFSVA